MKKQILSLALLLVIILMAFVPKDKTKPDDAGFSIKEIDKSVAKISDSLYAGKYEVSNILYRYWGYDLKTNNKTEAYKIYLPDTLIWKNPSYYDEPLVELYFRHPAYEYYPVVNISHEAAVLYCEWLTNKYNADPKRKFRKVLFRLPTEKEWETAARAGAPDNYSFPWGNSLVQNNKKMCNYDVVGDECIAYDTITKKYIIKPVARIASEADFDRWTENDGMPLPVDAYTPNKSGLYNVCGNVAEMVKENGIACGGSCGETRRRCENKIKKALF